MLATRNQFRQKEMFHSTIATSKLIWNASDSPSSFSLPSLLAAEVYEVVDPSDESEADALICPPVGGGPEPYQPPQPTHK